MRRRHRICGLIALALAAAVSSPGLAVAASTGTQCLSNETALYSGRFGRAVGSVCLSGDRLHYRYGPLGHPEIDVVSADDWSNIHYGGITGGGGGHQLHVRFSVGVVNYAIFEGMYGDATALPGRRWSGIYVGREDLAGTTIYARRRPIIAESWVEILRRHAPAAQRDSGVLEEQQGGPWDAWF